jgi:glucokinase
MRSEDLLVGVDVGGTKVAVLVVDSAYAVRSRVAMPTQLESPASTITGIADVVRKGVEEAGAHMSDVAAIGIGTPGRVDPHTGVVRGAVNLRWREVPVGDMLSASLRVPCLVQNDVSLAAVGARQF